MGYKFEKLDVWKQALEYSDAIYSVARALPSEEQYNLRSQSQRAVTSIALNIAEGSIGQSDMEQAKFLGYAIRSLVETVACLHLIHRRKYSVSAEALRSAYQQSESLFRSLCAMRNTLTLEARRVAEEAQEYLTDDQPPF